MRRGLIAVAIVVAFVAIFTLSRHSVPSSTTTTTTAPKSTTTTSSTSTTLASATCVASDFTGAYNEGEGAAGTIYASVTLTKATAGTCTLKGWPVVTLQDRLGAVLKSNGVDVPSVASGFQFPTPSQANAAPKTLTLSMNQTANFSLAYSDVPSGTTACESAVTVTVQFGGAGVPVTPAYAVQPCNNGQIWLSPFY
ncbi:MAG: hypothetical protein JWM55_1249 [Acidimicrobiaceae bacterium]|nr:hypothetical protein [Acidimicrobiaceae bacterium]